MEQAYNRIEADYKKWMERESRMEKLIPGTIAHNTPFLKEKLDFIENLQVRYKTDLNDEERLMVRVLQRERDNLATKLYPNRFFRLVRNLVASFRLQQKANIHHSALANNTAQLGAQLVRSGFGEVNTKMANHIKQGKPEFSIPVSYYPREHERLDFDLKFQRKETGEYRFMAYAAKLTNSETKQVRVHSFAADEPLKLNQHEIANLLAGRAVLVQANDVPWENAKWLQLDLNDKDAEGNYRIKEKNADESIDPIAVVKDIGIKQKQTGLDDDKMSQMMKQGDPINLSVFQQGITQTFRMELNPFQKGITFYDSGNNKVTIDQVLQKKNPQTRIVPLKPQRSLDAKQTKQRKGIN